MAERTFFVLGAEGDKVPAARGVVPTRQRGWFDSISISKHGHPVIVGHAEISHSEHHHRALGRFRRERRRSKPGLAPSPQNESPARAPLGGRRSSLNH